MPEINPEVIDLRVASGFISGLREWNENTTVSLRLVTKHQVALINTIGGILLFNDQRKDFFPDAWIQCRRFKGSDKGAIWDKLDINNNLRSFARASYTVFILKYVYDPQKVPASIGGLNHDPGNTRKNRIKAIPAKRCNCSRS